VSVCLSQLQADVAGRKKSLILWNYYQPNVIFFFKFKNLVLDNEPFNATMFSVTKPCLCLLKTCYADNIKILLHRIRCHTLPYGTVRHCIRRHASPLSHQPGAVYSTVLCRAGSGVKEPLQVFHRKSTTVEVRFDRTKSHRPKKPCNYSNAHGATWGIPVNDLSSTAKKPVAILSVAT